ncbi:MAG: DUF1673 family protein [Methanoregula sp.]
MQLAQTIRKYLGWCPQVHAVPQRLAPVLHENAADPPADATGTPAVSGWLNRYRNRVLLWSVFYTIAFIPFMGSFYALGFMSAVYIGIIAGLVIFAFSGRRLWCSFDLTLVKEKKQKTGPEGYIILFFVVGVILAAVVLLVMASLSIVPLETALELPAIAVGFAFIPWYVLILILLWERRTGYILVFDKKTFLVTVAR